MEKVDVNLNGFSYPMPCTLVGVNVEGKPNYLTVAWFSMVNLKPPYIGIILGKIHFTNPGIKVNGPVSTKIPSSDMVKVAGLSRGKNMIRDRNSRRFMEHYTDRT
jgi:flavin reductase (DIM6/NTAB) family NADH-FMN oxidoreductase RutF